jgi:hypothetical protein
MYLTLTNIIGLQRLSIRSEVAGSAIIAVNALRIVPAIDTNTTSVIVSIQVNRSLVPINFRIIIAFLAMTEAVASCI